MVLSVRGEQAQYEGLLETGIGNELGLLLGQHFIMSILMLWHSH